MLACPSKGYSGRTSGTFQFDRRHIWGSDLRGIALNLRVSQIHKAHRLVTAVPILFLTHRDMDSDMNMTNDTQAGMMMMMIPFLHFTGGDHLLFEAWLPTSGGAIGGACVGIFFFAILERAVHAVSPVLIQYLVQRYRPRISLPQFASDLIFHLQKI